MMASIGLQLASLVYIFLLVVVFLSTRKTITVENKMFSSLIILNMISAIINIVTIVLKYTNPEMILIINYLERIYKIAFVMILISFTEYMILILNRNLSASQKMQIYKKHTFLIDLSVICFSFIIFFIPINTYVKFIYPISVASLITYIVNLSCVIIWFLLVFLHRKETDKKILIPILISTILSISALIIEIFIPTIPAVLISNIYIVAIMYFTVFTIENPDVKLMEEITQARNEAQRANQSKTDFLADMSHEIRTPLNAILGFSQSLLEEEIPVAARDDVEDIISASDSLLDIVNEILDISKIESNKLELVNSEYSFDKVYKYLVSLTEGRIGNKQLEFIHKVDNNIPPVLYGDSARIKQIVVNLLTNSVKYTKNGFIKLNITSELIDDENCYIIINVEDSGIGIKEEDLNKLFSKFERFDLKKNMNVEGTGLGLALTKKLIDLMDGEIKVESKYGEGSKFIVKLKQKIVKKTTLENDMENIDRHNQVFEGHGEKVLIVDDNIVNLKVACRLLKKYNLNIELSSSGKDCIDKVLTNHYDLVLLDDMMPQMSGVETLKCLKEEHNYNVPIVALTANAITGMKEKYISQGFDDYLSKPIDKQLLESVLIKFFNGTEKNNVEDSKKTEDLIVKEEEKKILPVVNQMPEEIPTSKKSEPIEELEILDDFEEEKESQTTNDITSVKTEAVNPDLSTNNESVEWNEEYLKSNGVDLNAALELLGDMEMYNDTVKDFVAEIDTKMADIQKFYDAKDMPNYAILVHSLKSDSKYIGLMHLAELAYNHEMASKANDVDFVTNNYNELIEEATKMIDIIKKYAGV